MKQKINNEFQKWLKNTLKEDAKLLDVLANDKIEQKKTKNKLASSNKVFDVANDLLTRNLPAFKKTLKT